MQKGGRAAWRVMCVTVSGHDKDGAWGSWSRVRFAPAGAKGKQVT